MMLHKLDHDLSILVTFQFDIFCNNLQLVEGGQYFGRST